MGYYVSFGIEFKKQIDLVVSNENVNISKSIGIDLNAYNFAILKDVSKLFDNTKEKHLINNGSSKTKAFQILKLSFC